MSLNVRIAWRNLWRNRRRTWLTAGGISFAIFLVVSAMSLQLGQYDVMIENATSMMVGHIQLQDERYIEERHFEDTVPEASQLISILSREPKIASIAPRVELFALASVGERSFGVQVFGVDWEAERNTVSFLKFVKTGRIPVADHETIIGSTLARNLGVSIGDEIILLGAAKRAGVGAMAVTIVGLFETNFPEIDRNMVWVSLGGVREGFGLGDEFHSLIIRTFDVSNSLEVRNALEKKLASHDPRSNVVIRDWPEIMPEINQMIDIDRLSAEIMYLLLELIVVFSVINSFIIIVFERTKEFGMLIAIGMKPKDILWLVQWEAFFGWVIGMVVGVSLSWLLILWLTRTGIPLPSDLQELAAQMFMPSRIYPAFSTEAIFTAPLILLVGTQFAAFISSIRILYMRPIEVLRGK